MRTILNGILFLPVLVFGIGWHLWRILLMRPAYKTLGDTALPALSFALIFLASGLVRHTLLGGEAVLPAFFERLMFGVFLCLLAERSNRSSSLTAVFLGTAVVVDLTGIGMVLTGLQKTTELPFYAGALWQGALMVAAYAKFTREPQEVQARGYRRATRPVTRLS